MAEVTNHQKNVGFSFWKTYGARNFYEGRASLTPCPKHKGFYANRLGEIMTTKHMISGTMLREYKDSKGRRTIGAPFTIILDINNQPYVDLNQHKRAYYEYKNFGKKVPVKLVLVDELMAETFGKPRQFLGTSKTVPSSWAYFDQLSEKKKREAQAIKNYRAQKSGQKTEKKPVKPRIRKSQKRFFLQVTQGNEKLNTNAKLKKEYTSFFSEHYSTSEKKLNHIISQNKKKQRKLQCGVIKSRRSKSKKERVQVIFAARLDLERHRLEYELEKLGYDPSRHDQTSMPGQIEIITLEDRLLEQLLPENLAKVARSFFCPPVVKIPRDELKGMPFFRELPKHDPRTDPKRTRVFLETEQFLKRPDVIERLPRLLLLPENRIRMAEHLAQKKNTAIHLKKEKVLRSSVAKSKHALLTKKA